VAAVAALQNPHRKAASFKQPANGLRKREVSSSPIVRSYQRQSSTLTFCLLIQILVLNRRRGNLSFAQTYPLSGRSGGVTKSPSEGCVFQTACERSAQKRGLCSIGEEETSLLRRPFAGCLKDAAFRWGFCNAARKGTMEL
jgi:hypothetical protein